MWLGFCMVTWQPYKLYGCNLELPDEYKDHISMIYSCTACICFNVVTYNCPHKFFKQLGLAEVCIPNEMPNMNIHPKTSLSKNKKKDWKTTGLYAKVNEYWDKRHDYVVNAGQMDWSSGPSRNSRSGSSEQIHNEEHRWICLDRLIMIGTR
uniref:Uncharacterized protein n=2 Tax=Noccaea caerulescens TaxID=107243 RepID=A0A1J3GGN1_NOCCA